MEQLEECIDLIRNRAGYYSRIFKVEYEELISQGLEIYTNALETFDSTKASFITYLYHELGRLRNFCIYMKDNNYDIAVNDDIVYDESSWTIEKQYNLIQVQELLDFSKLYLSEEAYAVFSWIVSFSWNEKYITKPTITLACNHFKINRRKMTKIWKECENYWKNEGISLYSV